MLLTLLTFFPALLLATFVVPLPNGPYGVSIQDTLLTDYNLSDAYLNLTYRRVPISIISPTGSSANCEPVLQRYMPNTTAKVWEEAFRSGYGLSLNNTLTQTELLLCKPVVLNYSTPVILFAPSAGASRYLYNILGSAIVAQTGYTVITYDIPGQTEVVVFPDGDVEYALNSSVSMTATNDHAISVVVQDGLVVMNAVFSDSGAMSGRIVNISADPALPMALTNTSKAAMIGHSQGGAAALVGLLVDPRLSSGANMDGGLNVTADDVAICSNAETPLNCTTSTTTKPFMFFEHEGNNQSTADGWTPVWENVLQGDKWQVQLNGSQHLTFGDFPYLIDLYGVRERVNASLLNYVVGSVPGVEVLEVLSRVLGTFLGYGFGSPSRQAANDVSEVIGALEAFSLEIVNQTIIG